MEIDWTKPIQTADGQPARYLGKLEANWTPYRYIVAVRVRDDKDLIAMCDFEGNPADAHDSLLYDEYGIVNVPITHYAWINVYKDPRSTYPLSFSMPYSSKQQADAAQSPHRFACIKVEFEEGEGL